MPYRATFGKKSGKVFIINGLSFLVLGKNWEKTGKKIGKLGKLGKLTTYPCSVSRAPRPNTPDTRINNIWQKNKNKLLFYHTLIIHNGCPFPPRKVLTSFSPYEVLILHKKPCNNKLLILLHSFYAFALFVPQLFCTTLSWLMRLS